MNNEPHPYTTPQAPMVPPAIPQVGVPEDIRKKIKGGWIAAIISGTLTLAMAVIAMSSGSQVMGLDGWTLLDVFFIYGMAFGIFKRSRTCALLMLIYFVGSKIIVMVTSGAAQGIIVAVIFTIFYFQAVVGTFQYHSWKKSQVA